MSIVFLLLFALGLLQFGRLFDNTFAQWFEHTPKLELTDLQERKRQFDKILSGENASETVPPVWIENFFLQSRVDE